MFAARELSKLLKLGTIVLVYDQVSFVSAKSWAENPQLKQAALLNSASPDYIYRTEGTKTKPRSFVIKKARSKIIRAGLRINPGDFLLSHPDASGLPAQYRRHQHRGPSGTAPLGLEVGLTKFPDGFAFRYHLTRDRFCDGTRAASQSSIISPPQRSLLKCLKY